jgi:hypothetical protein
MKPILFLVAIFVTTSMFGQFTRVIEMDDLNQSQFEKNVSLDSRVERLDIDFNKMSYDWTLKGFDIRSSKGVDFATKASATIVLEFLDENTVSVTFKEFMYLNKGSKKNSGSWKKVNLERPRGEEVNLDRLLDTLKKELEKSKS